MRFSVRSGFVGSLVFTALLHGAVRADCNGNGIADPEDIEAGTSLDCNGNLIPDECEQSLLNLGQSHPPQPMVFPPSYVASVDFDADGDLDVIALGSGRGVKIGVLINSSALDNKQAGVFAETVNYETEESLSDLTVVDLDGDGALDVAAAARDEIFVFPSDGQGKLFEPQRIASPVRVEDFAAADLDGDGDTDVTIIPRTEGDSVVVLRNAGDGVFEDPELYPLDPATGQDPKDVICRDLDGDGRTDVIITSRRSENLLIWRGGEGGFLPEVAIPLGFEPSALDAADLDGDGSLDLIVSPNRAGALRFLLNTGDGVSFESATFDLRVSRFAVADVDGDLDLDVFTWTSNSDLLTVLLNDGAGRFGASKEFHLGLPLRELAPGDFDLDGDIDVAGAVSSTIPILPVFSNGEGEAFSMAGTTLRLPGSRPPHTGVLGDFDGDGDLDFVTGDGGNRTFSIVENDGLGNFTPKSNPPSGSYINSLAAQDFDGDGDLDLVLVPSNRDPFVRVHLNNGNAVFRPGPALVAGNQPFYVETADLNGDARDEIIVANLSNRSVSIFPHTGDENLYARTGQTLRVGNGPRGLTTGDFDQDGDLDLVTANQTGQDVSVLLNQGDGTFEEPTSYRAGGGPFFVVAGDWDRDGDLDLATANRDQQSIAVLFNQGAATFGDPQLTAIGQQPYSMRPGDMNGDGYLDLVTTNEVGSTVSVVMNQGDGSFFAFAHFRTGAGARYAPLGDVDDDGDLDIVSADRQGLSVTVLLNQSRRSARQDYVERICTPNDFDLFSIKSGAGARGIKYTIPARDDPSLLQPVFQNSRRFALHHEFLRTVFPDRFPGLDANALIGLSQIRASREYYIGAVERIRVEQSTLYVYSVVTSISRDEILTLEEVRTVHETLAGVFDLRPLAYAPDLSGQNPLARQAAESWGDAGFPVFLGTVDPPSDYIPYTQSVGYGRVRLFSAEEFEEANLSGRFTFQDIAVVAVAPRDIEGVVGGIITAAPQGALSHVSIRTARRGTPNAYVSGAMSEFAALEGQLVRLEVGPSDYEVRPATREEAEAFWAERPRLEEPRAFDPDYRRLDRFDEMDVRIDAEIAAETRYGGKASGLARLQTILVGGYEEYRERGFAIPMAHYVDFMTLNTTTSLLDAGREVTYQEYLEELFAMPEFQTDSERRFQALDDFRDLARDDGRLPDGLVEDLARRIPEVFGSSHVMVRFRSSSNVEDVLQFNGAGLYESTSVCVADSLDTDDVGPSHCDATQEEERAIERALKKVWTSLWTFRAHEERSFYQIPQFTAAMGILVNRAFLDETANGVAFTGDPTSPRGGCYLVTVQAGEESVVSPDPGVLPEVNILEVANGEVVGIVRALPSTLVDPGTRILSDDKLRELGQLMWHVDQTYPVDTEGHPREDVLLDLEFKLEPDGSLAVKQVRPFLTAGEKSSRPTFRLEIPAGAVVCGRQSLVSPGGDPRGEYERKSVVTLREGEFELPGSHCVFSADIVEEVLFGPEQQRATPVGPGLFRVTERTSTTGNRTTFSFSYRQFFTLPDGRELELDLVNLEFAALDGTPVRERLVVLDDFITNGLRMFAFVEDQTISYSSCDYESLRSWDVNADLADGTLLRVRERFEPAEDFTLTGPAAVEAAEVFIAGTRHFVRDYWRLVYSSARHNTGVRYWIILDAPVNVPGLASAVHAVEFAPADTEDAIGVVDVLQEESVTYLDENFQPLANPEITFYERDTPRRTSRVRFLRGDADVDGRVGLGDALTVLNYLFRRGAPFECESAADANDDDRINLGDATHLLAHLYRGGPLPAPNQLCDFDPTRDRKLECEGFSGCF